MILAIAAALVAGSIATGTIAFAAPQPNTPADFFASFSENFESADSFFDVFFDTTVDTEENSVVIAAEIARAIAAEAVLASDLAQEIADRIADVDVEEARALAAEAVLASDLAQEIADRIADVDAEEARALAAEAVLASDLVQEIADRIADVDAEEARALAVEAVLASDLAQEIADRIADVDAEEAARIAADNALATDIAAIGPHFSGNHADLTNVLSNQHHIRYTNTEAVAAVGPLTTNTNAATICGNGKFLNGDGTCDPGTSFTTTGFVTANIVEGGTQVKSLGPNDGRLCFLTVVGFRDIDSQFEDARCLARVDPNDSTKMILVAFADDDASAVCTAKCIKFR